jgi:basic membrane protein A
MRTLITLLAAVVIGFASAQDFVFGLNYDAGGKFDGSFNEGTFRGMERAIEALRAAGNEIDLLEFEGTPETSAAGLRGLSEAGADLIVAPGFNQADAIAAVSAEFPDTFYVLIDSVVNAPNVRSVVFKEHEGSFLVGFIAGSLTQTGVVGFIGGMDIPLIRAFDLGYQEGVKAACPECTIISNYTGVTPAAWNDPVTAKELATAQRAQGADIFYAAAGGSGFGVIDFVKETMCHSDGVKRDSAMNAIAAQIAKPDAYTAKCGAGTQPLFFIGVDSNQNFLGDTDNNPGTLNHGLTSMLKRVDVASETAAQDVVAGTFSAGLVSLGLAEGGVGYAIDAYNAGLIPTALVSALEDISAKIKSGELVVTDFRTQ